MSKWRASKTLKDNGHGIVCTHFCCAINEETPCHTPRYLLNLRTKPAKSFHFYFELGQFKSNYSEIIDSFSLYIVRKLIVLKPYVSETN